MAKRARGTHPHTHDSDSDDDSDLDPDNERPLFPESESSPVPSDAEVRRAIVAMNEREERRDEARLLKTFIVLMCVVGFVVFWILAHPHGLGS